MRTQHEWILPLGRRIRVSYAEILRILFSPTFLIFAEVVILLFIVFDVHRLSEDIGTPGMIVYWHLASVCTVFSCFMFLLFFDWLKQYVKYLPIYTLLITAIAVWPAVTVSRSVLALVTDMPFIDLRAFIREGLVTMSAVTLVGFILFEYCLDYILGRSTKQTTKPVLPKTLWLGGQVFTLREIVFVKSAGHYLEVELKDGSTRTIYGKLSTLDKSSEAGLGLSPHRSYWVPGHAVRKLSSEGKKTHLDLISGKTIPVASAKKKYVRDWLLDHVPGALK